MAYIDNQTDKISGLYKIVNKVNGKFYIGSSDDIFRRFKRHQNDLKKSKHDNAHLQNAWNKYGESNFSFEIWNEYPAKVLLQEEQKVLNEWVGKDKCYNIRVDAKCIVLPGTHRPDWVKEKISLAQKGKTRWTEEQRKQMSISRKGRKHKPETIAKFLGRKSAYENIRKAQLFNVGRVYSEEHKTAISVGKKRQYQEKVGV